MRNIKICGVIDFNTNKFRNLGIYLFAKKTPQQHLQDNKLHPRTIYSAAPEGRDISVRFYHWIIAAGVGAIYALIGRQPQGGSNSQQGTWGRTQLSYFYLSYFHWGFYDSL